MKLERFLLIFLLLFSLPSLLLAQQGRVILEKGQLKLNQAGQIQVYRIAGDEAYIYAGDEIHTGENSRAKLMLKGDDENVVLYSNTFFKVEELAKKKSSVSLWIGKAKFSISSLINKVTGKKEKDFRINSVTATIGIKGTEFVVGSTATGTKLLTLSGNVNFSSQYAPDIIVNVGPNEASRVVRDNPPTPPVQVSEELKNRILSDDNSRIWTQEALDDEINREGEAPNDGGPPDDDPDPEPGPPEPPTPPDPPPIEKDVNRDITIHLNYHTAP